jgi:hypothetical protein
MSSEIAENSGFGGNLGIFEGICGILLENLILA